MSLTHSTKSRKKEEKRTLSTSLSSSMWDKVRERGKEVKKKRKLVAITITSNNLPLMAYKAKDLRKKNFG